MKKTHWVLGGFVAAFLYPQQPVVIDFRGFSPQGLTIGVDRMSPAFAALEDTRDLAFIDKAAPVKKSGAAEEEAILMGAGKPFSLLDTFLGGEDSSQGQVQPESRHEADRWLPLAGLTISSDVEPTRSFELPAAESPEWMSLPLAQRKDLLVEKFRNEPIHWPSFTERLTAAAEREFGPAARSDRNPLVKRESTREPEEQDVVDLPGFRPASTTSEAQDPVQVSGMVRMQGGLAYMGEKTQVKVFRKNRGQFLESASVELPSGQFSIDLAGLSGELVAELQTREGEVLGRGEVDLGLLATTEDSVKIALLPAEEGLRISALSAHSHGLNKKYVEGSRAFVDALALELKANEEGVFFDQLHSADSSYIARLEAPKHWTTLAVGLASQAQDVRLFPNSMMEALFSLTADVYAWDVDLLKSRAVIWGRVTEKGQSKAGAKVELAQAGLAEVIYLNQHFLPDHRLEATSENGLFVILMVESGIHSLRATVGRRSLPSVIVPAEVGKVSYLEMEAGPNRKATIQLTQPFGAMEEDLTGTISLLGSEHVLDVEAEESIVYSSGPGQMILEASAGREFEVTRVTLPRQTRDIELPMIPRQWLLDVSAQKRVSYDLSSGVVVGFVHGDNFSVYLEDGLNYPNHQIVYFDQEGRVLDGMEGVSGGGFVLFNLPFGARTVTVLPKNQSSIFTQVVVPEARVVNVISHSFKP